jgi:two-component system sensor kinase
MNQLFKTIFDELTINIEDRKIILDLKDLPCTNGDISMMKQAIMNLISNSIKFTRIKEKAVIEVGFLNDEKEKVYYIKDNGVGFDTKYIDKLFGVFQRLHRADEYEGTGIGLALVQRIIHRHGGSIWAEGKVNEGTTIFFTLD